MINRQAVRHRPLSEFAYAPAEYCLTIRLQAARNNLKRCTLFYGDRVDPHPQVRFRPQNMEKVASDDYFDYYETTINSEYDRVCYYFSLDSAKETLYLYADIMAKTIPTERSEFYQYPFIRREEISDVPAWLKKAVVYNIFPDSFADSARNLSCQAQSFFDQKTGQTLHSRLGGTIRGIIANIDYITELGFNCLYLNPIFTAAEYHRYDLLDYYHVSPNLGTDADFRELVQAVHARGMHIIIDGVFNHCSWYFFAFDDVVKNGENSRYKDWFYNLQFPVRRPESGEKPQYSCFAYEPKMPKLNSSNPEVRNYFLDVCRYWIEEFDVDGWRLDVANELDKDFWRAFRKTAKKAKPDSVLIAEIWENSARWLQGDMFDSTMNYDFRRHCRDFFASGKIDAAEFNSRLIKMNWRYPFPIVQGQLNLLDSHDVSRFRSLCICPERFYLAEVFLFTAVGVPCVFYGDELGVQGEDEYSWRGAMPWDKAIIDDRNFFQHLIRIRQNNECLVSGSFQVLDYSPAGNFVFARARGRKKVVVALNVSACVNEQFVNLPSETPIFSYGYNQDEHTMMPYAYAIWEIEEDE